MGAILSLPLIPVQMAASAVSGFAGSALGSFFSSCMSNVFGGDVGGIGARVLYALFFLLNSLFSWLMLSNWAASKLDLLRYTCRGEECTRFVAVQRISTALGLVHLGLALIQLQQRRPAVQNGWWKTKLLVYFTFLGTSFFLIPAGFWVVYGNYVAPLFAFVFVFINLVLLVDAAHTWAETCIDKIDRGQRERLWKFVLVNSTVGMYIGAVIMSALMLAYFSGKGCSTNQAVISLNLVFAVLISVLSVNPAVQDSNPRAGLAQAAMVAVYGTYLVLSAVTSEPDGRCNPAQAGSATREVATVVGAGFTFIAIAYTTTRAASRAIAGDTEAGTSDGVALTANVRRDALHRAVRDGYLPPAALENADWLDDDERVERDGYNYVIFHIVFFLATQYTASILTINVNPDAADHFAPVGRSFFVAWVRIASSWICYALYVWSLIAPVVFPDRF